MSTIPNHAHEKAEMMKRFDAFAMPFKRFFWKEYRVHRALWLSCLSLGFLFQFTFGLVPFIDPASRLMFLLPTIFTVMYAIGCGAILFASEREERTSDWLLSLSVPAGPTLAAKICFAVVSTLVLQLLLHLISFELVAHGLSNQFDLDRIFDSTALTVLIWSILGSLVSRRVMVSILAMVVWTVGTLILPVMIFHYLADTYLSGRLPNQIVNIRAQLITSLCFSTVVLDVYLGQRWCRGQYLDGTILERWKNRLKDRLVWVPTPSIVYSRIPLSGEYEQPWRRTWQRLIWHERHRESLHLLLPICICVIGLVFAAMDFLLQAQGSGQGGSRGVRLTMFTHWFCLAIPFVLGLMGFADIDPQRLAFLSNRGISMATMWCAKQAVWLSRAFWMTVISFAICFFWEWLIVPQQSAFSPVGLDQTRGPFEWNVRQIQSRPDIAFWYVLLSYGCGQLASMLFRRVVLSFVFGIIFNAIAVSWMLWICDLAVPRWWALGLPISEMFLITFWQTHAKLLDRQSRSYRLTLNSVLVLTMVTLLLMVAFYHFPRPA